MKKNRNKKPENVPTLAELHKAKDPLIIYNIWDAGSAKAVEKKVIEKNSNSIIGTSSWAVAASKGYKDGEKLPFEDALKNLKEILKAVSIPVTFDFESGFATTAEGVKKNVIEVIECGARGINFEDQIIDREGQLYSISEQCKRIQYIRQAVDDELSDVFINARTDIFLQKPASNHTENDLLDAIERSKEYAKAGAHGFFAPGLTNIDFIKELCKASPIPVNIMVSNENDAKALYGTGVARISFGPAIYLKIADSLENFVSNSMNLMLDNTDTNSISGATADHAEEI